jgi:nitrogenase-associated protein
MHGDGTMKIVFYEKPGCINNGKQKNILAAAGHTLECRDILQHPWQEEELLAFVAGKKPAAMMNHTAPAIKNGEIDPKALTFEQAFALMLENPILIRRPLIEVEGRCIQGFDHPLLQPYLGSWDGREDVITCPKLHATACDEQEEEGRGS